MSRVKLTANNHCHKPVKGGAAVEALIDAAADGRLEEHLSRGNSINAVANNGVSALHALARKNSGTKRDRLALHALLDAGIAVDLCNASNETALFRALKTRACWMFQPLFEAGASGQVVNSKGVSLRSLVRDEDAALSACFRAQDLDISTPSAPSPGMRRRSL